MSADTVVPESQKEKTFEFKRLGFSIKFTVSGDGLVCMCDYEPSPAGLPITFPELTGFFSEAKIREGIDEEAVKILLSSAEQKKRVSDLVIATGYPMQVGEDGKIDISVLQDKAEDKEEETGQVDLRHVQDIINVSAEQLIGTVLPPGEGTPGKTVFGITIPAQSGIALNLTLGKQVRLGEDGRSIYAEADGRLFIKGGEISVEDIYVVKGDVNFRVGNINYNGYLEVRGDVLDGFSINATKGIKILGNIGTCRIESQGDISFCGMSGQEKGSIFCGSSITANFIHDTIIECHGNLQVETEIRNCEIKSLGIVQVNKGVLVGGSCIAMGGVEVATAGSPSSLFTRIVVGINYNDLEELNLLFNELKLVLEEFKLSKDRTNSEALIKKRASIADKIQEIRSRCYDTANAKVNIKKKLYEKVSLTLDKISEEVREERPGPVSIILNTVEGGLRFLSMTDLSVKAADLESFFVKEAERARETRSLSE